VALYTAWFAVGVTWSPKIVGAVVSRTFFRVSAGTGKEGGAVEPDLDGTGLDI